MSQDQIAIFLSVSFIVISCISVYLVYGLWSKKHRLFVVLYYELNNTPDLCEYICKSHAEASFFVNSYCSLENVSLLGVYSFVPDCFYKEFGGSILHSKIPPKS